MNIKIQASLVALLWIGVALARDPQFENAPYMDSRLSAEARAEDLVQRMTMAEKIALLCSTSGFRMYDIRDGEVCPSKALVELYAKFPSCALSSFFRADWYSGRNWKTGLAPELLIKAHNAMQRYAVENTRLGVPLMLNGGQMLGETSIPSGLACASSWDLDAIDVSTLNSFAGCISYAAEVDVPKRCDLRLRVEADGLVVEVFLDGVSLGERGVGPFEWKIPESKMGDRHSLEIRLHTSVRPIFGPESAPGVRLKDPLWCPTTLNAAPRGLVRAEWRWREYLKF